MLGLGLASMGLASCTAGSWMWNLKQNQRTDKFLSY